MLQLVSAVDGVFSISSMGSVIISGRIVSAASIAVACCAFALFVFNRFGIIFGLLAGILIALSPTVFVSGHYFKEDAVLLMGIAISMLSMQRYERDQSIWSSILVGVAVGAACASKYVGVLMAIPAAFVFIRSRASVSNILAATLSSIVFFCAMNYPAFLAEGSIYEGFKYEAIHVATEHNGLRWGPTSPRTLIHYFENVSLLALILFIIGGVSSLKKLTLMDGVVLLTPILWLFTVQLSAVSFVRYAMPAIALTLVGAVWFSAKLCEGASSSLVQRALILVLSVAGILSTFQTWKIVSALRSNPRDRTTEWVRTNLPTDSVIAADFYAGLQKSIPQKISDHSWNLPKGNTPESLREQGITHIVVSSSSFKRYFDPYVTLSPSRGMPDKKFYTALFSNYKPIHVERGYLASDEIISSDILVFDIRK